MNMRLGRMVLAGQLALGGLTLGASACVKTVTLADFNSKTWSDYGVKSFRIVLSDETGGVKMMVISIDTSKVNKVALISSSGEKYQVAQTMGCGENCMKVFFIVDFPNRQALSKSSLLITNKAGTEREVPVETIMPWIKQ